MFPPEYFNPRPPRGERPGCFLQHRLQLRISIHALREESDYLSAGGYRHSSDFNPRPPRGERPLFVVYRAVMYFHFNPRPPRGERQEPDRGGQTFFEFQSTPSARRATEPTPAGLFLRIDFNPRPPRGERRARCGGSAFGSCISIHALREESDLDVTQKVISRIEFQSTPSARRATPVASTHSCAPSVFQSTPSARRATAPLSSSRSRLCNFNPRPPRGERRSFSGTMASCAQFQSTPSARRATVGVKRVQFFHAISIHALREESDRQLLQTSSVFHYFNPRPPRGERRLFCGCRRPL